MSKDLKKVSVSGMLYRFGERILAQAVSTLVTIILARILLPEDYGVVSLLTIFISLCNVLISDGLSTALIQKKDADELDFSTICWASLVLSVFLYAFIFCIAPYIAAFYKNDLLCPTLRVMGIKVVFAAFNSVQSTYVSKNFLFKKFFYATLIGTITSGVVGIIFALRGAGSWALVAQYLTNSFMDMLFLFLTIDWKPKLIFSWSRFKSLFSFGWKILASGLLNELYENFRSLIIAKQYSTADLSFYTKGKQFPQMIGNNVTSTITNVMFPVFSTQQDNKERLKAMVRRSTKIACYVLCPMMIGFASISETFVRLVLTDKWLPAVPFMQIFCIMFIFKPLRNINRQVIKATKRGGLDMGIIIAEKTIGITLIICFLKKGTLALAITAMLTYVIGMLLYSIFGARIIDYSFSEALIDTVPYFLFAGVCCLPSFFMNSLTNWNMIGLMILQIISAALIYLILSIVLKIDSFFYLKDLVMDFIKKK